jgi:hypothetical protein
MIACGTSTGKVVIVKAQQPNMSHLQKMSKIEDLKRYILECCGGCRANDVGVKKTGACDLNDYSAANNGGVALPSESKKEHMHNLDSVSSSNMTDKAVDDIFFAVHQKQL